MSRWRGKVTHASTATGARSTPLALNAICPYFTMFPLDFPLSVLEGARQPQLVLDPFAGRGTTLYAARLRGLPSAGIDSNPVAIAISQAKLVLVTPEEIMSAASDILQEVATPSCVPEGEFWRLAYHPEVLHDLCRLREGLLRDASTPARKALRAIILGALHGPLARTTPSYLSNQSPRTYAPKPAYAVRFWTGRGLYPPKVDVLEVIDRRARRYYGHNLPPTTSDAVQADSRQQESYRFVKAMGQVSWVITSPPYLGMRTYRQDQWLRLWFLGGPPCPDYRIEGQLSHANLEAFANDLRQVWRHVASVCHGGAQLVIRFGAINSRKVDPVELLRASLNDTPWVVERILPAYSAHNGRRQADHFVRSPRALDEVDVWARHEA